MASKKKSYFNIWNYFSSERLCNAIHNGANESTILDLLRDGVDMEAKDSKGYTPLLLACEFGKKNISKLLINCGANVDQCDDNKKRTALHLATRNGWKWLDVVQLLVNRVSDLDARDHCGTTALHNAASNGDLEMVKCLVEAGADINVKSDQGTTPLVFAAQSNCKDLFDFLFDAGADVSGCDNRKNTVLHHVARNKWSEVVPSLVKRVPDLNATCDFGMTALHLASYEGNLDMVKCLVEAGADINLKCLNRATPLVFAAEKGHKGVFDFLLNAGSDVNGFWSDGTVLHWAAFHGWADALESLAKRLSHHLDARGNRGDTALQIGTMGGHFQVVKILADMKADLNVRNSHGQTALIIAVQKGMFATAEYLVRMNASCSITDVHDNSALQYLILQGSSRVELMKLLVIKAADLQAKDFSAMLKSPLLKEAILQNVHFCCHAIIHKYNDHELPELYKSPVADRLPCMEKMKIGSQSEEVLESIERSVKFEIQEKGHCDFYYVRLKALNVLCVKSLLKYYGKNLNINNFKK